MKDILGRKLKVGDIVAHGTRAGNGGSLSVKIIADLREQPIRYNKDYTRSEAKVINYKYVEREYNDVEPHYEKGGTGWAQGEVLIVTESIPIELREFLESLI